MQKKILSLISLSVVLLIGTAHADIVGSTVNSPSNNGNTALNSGNTLNSGNAYNSGNTSLWGSSLGNTTAVGGSSIGNTSYTGTGNGNTGSTVAVNSNNNNTTTANNSINNGGQGGQGGTGGTGGTGGQGGNGYGGQGGAGGSSNQTQQQQQQQQSSQANQQNLTSSPAQSITQNFEAGRVLPTAQPTFAQGRDLQLYTQQGGTSNVAGAKAQLMLRFTPREREVVVENDVKMIFVASSYLKDFRCKGKQTKGNRIDVWHGLPATDILATATLLPNKRGDNVDVNSLLFSLQRYLDCHYDGLVAVTTSELLASTYGNKSAGSAFGLSPTAVFAATSNWVLNGAGAGGMNNAATTPEGFVGLTCFIISMDKAVEPPVIVAPPAAVSNNVTPKPPVTHIKRTAGRKPLEMRKPWGIIYK